MAVRKAFVLGLDPAAYNPVGLKAYSEKELQHEYARIRREANERLVRLGRSEFADLPVYQDNVDKFIPIRQLSSRRELERLIIEGSRFVTALGSSASGQRVIRKRAITSLQEQGITFVTSRNYSLFSKFMGELKSGHIEGLRYIESDDKAKAGRFSVDPDELQELFEDWADENWLS